MRSSSAPFALACTIKELPASSIASVCGSRVQGLRLVSKDSLSLSSCSSRRFFPLGGGAVYFVLAALEAISVELPHAHPQLLTLLFLIYGDLEAISAGLLMKDEARLVRLASMVVSANDWTLIGFRSRF